MSYTAQDAIRRLCELQAEVARTLDPQAKYAADCFCGEDGFRHSRHSLSYRNDWQAIAFIEGATRAGLVKLREDHGRVMDKYDEKANICLKPGHDPDPDPWVPDATCPCYLCAHARETRCN